MALLKSLLTFRWANRVSELAGYLSAVALVLATLAMLHSVITRYVFKQPTIWQTETSIYLLIFVTFVGATFGLKHHAHVGVDLLVERLPTRPQLVVRIITSTLALVVVLAVVYTAGHTWYEAYEGGFRTPTALRAPLSVVYAILPLGMILVACQYLAFIIEAVLSLLGHREGQGVALLGQGNAELAAVRAAMEEEDASFARETAVGTVADADRVGGREDVPR